MPPIVARDAVEMSTGNHSPFGLQPAIEFVQYDAGLDPTAPPLRIERQDLGKPFRTINDQRRIHRLPALRGSSSSRQNGNVAQPCDAQGSRRLFDRARNDDPEWSYLIGRGVGRITAPREGVEQNFADAFPAQRALQPGNRTGHLANPSLGIECL